MKRGRPKGQPKKTVAVRLSMTELESLNSIDPNHSKAIHWLLLNHISPRLAQAVKPHL